MALATYPEIKQFVDRLQGDRGNYESVWQEISDHILGSRDFGMSRSQAEKRTTHVYDTTGMQASAMLAAGLHNFLTNTATDWHREGPRDVRLAENPAVSRWFEDVTDIMNAEAFGNPVTGFVPAMHEFYTELVNFGSAALFTESVPGLPILYTPIPLSQMTVAEDAFGRINLAVRKFQLTHRQAVRYFGAEQVPKAHEKVRQGDGEGQHEYWNLVHERGEPVAASTTARNRLPWRSAHISIEEKRIVREGGFHENPYIVARWEREPGETYGRGPGWRALPSCKLANAQQRTLLETGLKIARPPMFALDDGVTLPLNTGPGKVNTVNTTALLANRDPVWQMRMDASGFPITVQAIEMTQQQIKAAYLHDLLEIFRTNFRTATQVSEIVQRAQALLSPVVGRLQGEALEPVVSRTFGVLFRARRFPPPPPILRGTDVEVAYLSPIQRSQKLTEVEAIDAGMARVGGIAQMRSDVLDNIDFDEVTRDIVKGHGLPVSYLRSAAAVEQSREAQRELAEREAQLEEAERVARAAGQAAPALQAIEGGRA